MLLQILVFYILTFFFTFLLGGLQQATGINPGLSIPQLGPGLGALVSLLVFRKTAVKPNFSLKPLKPKPVLLSILFPVGATLIVALVTHQVLPPIVASGNFGLALLLWIPIGALGEELGWRGFLQANLDRKWAGWLSCLVVGLLWTPFHVQFLQNGVLFLAVFALLLIAYTTVLYVLMKWSEFNVWIAMLFHTAINATNLFFYSSLNEVRFMAINVAVWGVIALVMVLTNRDLFFSRKD